MKFIQIIKKTKKQLDMKNTNYICEQKN